MNEEIEEWHEVWQPEDTILAENLVEGGEYVGRRGPLKITRLARRGNVIELDYTYDGRISDSRTSPHSSWNMRPAVHLIREEE